GDVATAGTAGTDVTRVHAGQQEQSESELQAAENGVAPPPAAPDAERSATAPAPDDAQPGAENGPAETDPAPADSADAGPADSAGAGPADGDASAAAEPPPVAEPPSEDAPPAKNRSAKNRPAKNSSGRTRNGAQARTVIGGVRPARTGSSGDTSAAAAGTAAVRRRLARLGAPRGGGANPVLEPLIKTGRATHPKADVRLLERAYDVAARKHAGQVRKSGDPYITHPLAVATILAELGMNSETLCAALLHD